jgi:hypothetical protein
MEEYFGKIFTTLYSTGEWVSNQKELIIMCYTSEMHYQSREEARKFQSQIFSRTTN